VIPAVGRHSATVIMAHGLGDSGAGWISLAQNWRRREKFSEVKFVFPNAPNIPISVNFGMQMPGWYDIVRPTMDTSSLTFENLQAQQDEVGVLKSQTYFHDLIKQEIDSGIPSDRIVLGGFSQGGAMAIFSGLTSRHKLGGVFGLSCYLLLHTKIQSFIPPENPNLQTPIFMGHGDSDPLVKPQWAEQTAKVLKDWSYKVDLKMYRGLEHSADPDEIDDLEKYLNERIPAQGDKASAAL